MGKIEARHYSKYRDDLENLKKDLVSEVYQSIDGRIPEDELTEIIDATGKNKACLAADRIIARALSKKPSSS